MKQYKLIQVALLAILLFGWAGCSQNEEEVPGNVRNGIVLNVTDTGIISNEPSTRTEDTGFVTTFTQGDQIGLFAVKGDAILDEINNMPFTFNPGLPTPTLYVYWCPPSNMPSPLPGV